MSNLRPAPISENLHSSWQNVVQKTIQAQNPVAGSGLRTQNVGEFTRISIPNDIDFNRLVWKGNFDVEAEYFPNDVVRVLADVEYIDVTTGDPLEVGSTTDDTTPICLGTFVCVQHVPPSWANEDYFFSTVVTSFPETIPYTWQNGIRWDTYNTYYPICPEIPSSMTSSVDPAGYGFTITANDTFWQRMSSGDGGEGCQCRYH